MKLIHVFPTVLVLFFALADQQHLAPSDLVIKNQTSVEHEKAQDFVDPVVSDLLGNIYARYGDGEHPVQAITKISPDGRKLQSFDISAARLPDLRIVDFEADGQENLVILARSIQHPSTTFMVVLAPNGSIRSQVKLDASVEPYQFALLKGGNVVLAGRAPEVVGTQIDSLPLIAVVDGEGRFVKKIDVTGDITPTPAAERAMGNGATKKDRAYEDSLSSSLMATADDGRVFLMRRGKSGVVLVFSPDGSPQRKLSLDLPPGTSLHQIKVAKNRIAAVFIRKLASPNTEITAAMVRVYDAGNGQLLHDYALPSSVPILLAAYDGDERFTFFGADAEQNLKLFHVAPK